MLIQYYCHQKCCLNKQQTTEIKIYCVYRTCWDSTGLLTVWLQNGWDAGCRRVSTLDNRCFQMVFSAAQKQLHCTVRLLLNNRKDTSRQITAQCNSGELKGISECAAHSALKGMGYSSTRPCGIPFLSAYNKIRLTWSCENLNQNI